MEGMWRERLADAISRGDKSMREVSLAAGLGPGYVHSILKDGKEPTIEKLIAVCRAADVSLSAVVYGFDLSPETEDLLSLLAQADDEDRDALLKLLRRKHDENQQQLPPPLQDQSSPESDKTQTPS